MMRVRISDRLRTVLVLLGVALTGATPTPATTALAQLSIDELTDRADAAVHGTIESMEAARYDDQIFTTIEVSVLEELKGRLLSRTATLRLYGGVFEGRRTWIVGAPCLTLGEEVVLFLKENGESTYDVVSLAEGKFQVVRTESGTRVERDLTGISYLESTTPNIPTSLSSLKAAIRAAAR
jgi:hypothetical protein